MTANGTANGTSAGGPGPRLLDRVRHAVRKKHYSLSTEKGYVGWIRRFIPFPGKQHPAAMEAAQVWRSFRISR
ncbi:MAG: phage integrase N-terminal SAM-like domain-containing protein [Pseudomonadota bacterium]